jgi:hypothetical protein
MNRIATEVPEKVLMFFQDRNRNAFSCKQEPQHDSRRTAAYNATGRLHCRFGHSMTSGREEFGVER